MAKPQRRPQTDVGTRERILQAARELFADQGYSATSTSQIAKRAQVLPGSLYWAFPSKERLFIEVLATTAEEWKARVLPDDKPERLGPANIREQMQAVSAGFREGPEFLRLLMIVATEHQAGSPEILEAALGVRRFWRDRIEQALAAGLSGYDPDEVQALVARIGRLLLQLLDGAFMSLQLERSETTAEALFAEVGDVLARELAFGVSRLRPLA